LDICVVTPAHPARLRNGLLDRALRSVAMQTSPPAAMSVVVDLKREGAAPTRQRALMLAKTKWVAFLDSDDVFKERHLELLSKYVVEHNVDMAYSWFEIVDGQGRIRPHDQFGDGIFPPGHYRNPFDPENPIETTITTLVRTELAQEVGMVALDRGEMNSGEDRRFTLGVLAAGGKIGHLVRTTWLYGHHGANTSGLPTKGDAAG
jgi:hypothetical protein